MPVIQENISLRPFNTFAISVNARYFVEIFSESDLELLLSSGFLNEKELLILGGGSNVLFTKDFPGVVVKMNIGGLKTEVRGDDLFVTAGAGVVWNDFVQFCVNSGLSGVENLSLIPGTVGASPIQNIGAYGVELKDVFHSCTAFEIKTGLKKIFDKEECEFGYRDSVFKSKFKGQYIISSVCFRLHTSAALNVTYGAIQTELSKREIAQPTIQDVSKVVSQIRVSKLPDPSTIGNAGSFFKNPVIPRQQFDELYKSFPDIVHYPAGEGQVKLAAGWLIESCGFKGKTEGQTGTWKNQALVLVNLGHATGQEVYSFSEQIINAVCQKFGLKLEREVNIL
ncbi:UDP-N-acetylmuramate dehydrogenase [Pedobacter nutrimenti]|uniref:UDP-N-acetylenolpyruvoylglucosamine reductase n=1 Tax=Pedobacter nutrimenti TaxID=1241337 RepID=A0A318U7E6_9SPHI|nr:UDP-N-acetylmuramate dehydrogenase [Pedobacter nutrimenti]PYF69988.1 UDP-N-acetylmuramate dehydrogenase [Pedobacter nutrimenti]